MHAPGHGLRTTALLLLISALTVSACRTSTEPTPVPMDAQPLVPDDMIEETGDVTPAEATGDRRWPFGPARMRVHPLTRVTTDASSGQTIVEARVEFLDRHDDRTKCFGDLALDLYGLPDQAGAATPLSRWGADLTRLDRNRDFFDDVTGTYRFTIPVDIELPRRVQIRVTYRAADGLVLKATHELQ